MDLFFLENYIPNQTRFLLSEEESRHIHRVHRKQKGDVINLTDGKGLYLKGMILGKKGKSTEVLIKSIEKREPPFENQIEIALAIIRPNRMDWAVEKLVELGIQRIVPLVCHLNTIKKVKLDHLNRIAKSALKQSNQFYLPDITEPILFEEYLENLSNNHSIRIIAHSNSQNKLNNLQNLGNFNYPCICIGPEGGFTNAEIDLAQSYQFVPVNLGDTVLRTETASIVIVSILKSILKKSIS